MATPHVVDLGAYLIGLQGASKPGPLCDKIRTLATKNALSRISGVPALFGTPNLLAYNEWCLNEIWEDDEVGVLMM